MVQTIDPLAVDYPAFAAQHRMNAQIAVPGAGPGNVPDPLLQRHRLHSAGLVQPGRTPHRPAWHSPQNTPSTRAPAPSTVQALKLFSNHLLQHVTVQAQVRHHLLQTTVLILQLLQPAYLRRGQPPELHSSTCSMSAPRSPACGSPPPHASRPHAGAVHTQSAPR